MSQTLGADLKGELKFFFFIRNLKTLLYYFLVEWIKWD